jgi:hypothetical protein
MAPVKGRGSLVAPQLGGCVGKHRYGPHLSVVTWGKGDP